MAQLSTPAPLLERLLSPHHAPLEGAAGTLDSYSVFPVPDMPRIGRHTEPRPFHKSAPGYDMKTLRRQLDAMAGELEERFALQAALYRQNESLWAFAESLLRLNQQYGEQTGRQLTVLQTRFRLLQGERVGVCVQMVEAQGVYRSLLDQRSAADDLLHALDMHNQRREHLKSEIHSVSDENGQLESELQSRAGEVLRVHRELQGAAAVRDSDAALQRADRHFFSSRTALRGAFRRFRRSVLQAVGVGRATQVLLRHFHAFVAGKIFSSWAGVIRAKRFGAAQEQRRALLAAVNCFSRWKTYSALQSHFKARAGMRTGRLVATVMDRWRGLAAERRWAQWAETASTQLQSRRLQRRVFAAWRKGTVFLPWTGDWLRVPSQLAHRHHRRRLLDAWRAVAAQSAGEDAARTKEVGVLILRRAIASWRLSQLAVPAFRNTGRKRVLRALRTACEEHAAGVLLEAAARGHRCRWSARRALWRMYHASGARAKCRSAELQLLEAAEYRETLKTKAVVRSVLLLWAARTAFLKRSYLSSRLAIDHRRRSLLSGCFNRLQWMTGLYVSGRYSAGRPPAIRDTSSRWALLLWRRRAVLRAEMHRQEDLSVEESSGTRGVLRLRQIYQLASAHHAAKLKSTTLPACFRFWRTRATHFGSQRRALQIVQARNLRASVRGAFLGWRASWARRLCWKAKAAAIDQSELFAQIKMQQADWSNMESEKQEVETYIAEVTAAAERMQRASIDKQQDIEHARVTTESLQAEAHALQLRIVELEAARRQAREERLRASYMEEILAKEAVEEQVRAREQTAAAAALLSRLNAEARDMRLRVEEARQRVEDTQEAMAEASYEQEEGLAEALAAARNLHEVAERRTIDLEGCEDARRALETAVEGIRARLAGLGEDTAAALSEEQARLRTTTAEVRALRQSTSQTEARVIAMREFTAQRMAVLAARRREIADQEVNREIGSAGEDADLWVRRQTAGLSPLCMVDTATPKKTACKTVSAGTKANSTFRARKGSNVKKDASSIISRRAAALR